MNVLTVLFYLTDMRIRLKDEYKGYKGDEYMSDDPRDMYDELCIPVTSEMIEAVLTYRRNEGRERKRRLKFADIDLCDELSIYDYPSYEDKYIKALEVIKDLDKVKRRRIKRIFIEGKTYREIAKEEDISENGIRRSVSRILKDIRRKINE